MSKLAKISFTIFIVILLILYCLNLQTYNNYNKSDTLNIKNQNSANGNKNDSTTGLSSKTITDNIFTDNKTMPIDIKKIIDRKKLIVGVYSEDRPPFFMTKKDGTLEGLDIDIAKDIAKGLGVDIEFKRQAKSFGDFTKMLVDGELDLVISKFSRTYERSKSLRFSKPYINLKQALLVSKVVAVKKNIEAYPMEYLKNEKVKIGVIAGTSFVEYAKSMFKKAVIVECKDWDTIQKLLSKGELVAAMYDDNEIVKMVRNNPEVAIYATVYVLKDKKDPICIGASWESPDLIEWVNSYLDTNSVQKDVNSLIEEYPEIYKQKQ